MRYRVNSHTVPYWKALRYGKDGLRGLSCGITSSICQDILKSDNLLHKQGFVDSQMKSTVVSILTNFCLFQPILTGNGHLLGQISLGQISEPLPKRPRIFPPTNERIMIYVKQETEDAFTALHVKPPTAQGLIGKGNY